MGAKISKAQLPNEVVVWAISSSQYIQEAIQNVENHLKTKREILSSGTNSLLTNGYHPECDVSGELFDEDVTYCQSLFGVLRWIVEMGRIDIYCEVSMMSSYVAMPREGHLQQLYHIFSYLKK